MNSNINRRNFIKKSALVTGAALVAPTIIPACSKGANDRVLIGHIGVGSMGSSALKHWFMPVTEAYNVASCDPFKNRREIAANYMNKWYADKGIKAPESKAYLHMEELLERSDIDAVNITTPDHWHLPAAIKAARAGKHIFLAKPLGLHLPHYKLLEKEVSDNNVVFHYGTQQRSMAHIKLAMSLILEGRIGKIERADVWAPGGWRKNVAYTSQPIPEGFDYDKWTGPAKMNPYCDERVTNAGAWFQWDYSIGWLAGWGAHPLDILAWGVKEQISGKYTCEGIGEKWQDEGIYNTVYSWNLKYKYDSGFELHFLSTNEAQKNKVMDYRTQKDGNSTTFFGDKGWISIGRSTAESNIPEIQKMFDSFPRNDKGVIVNDGHKAGQDFVDVINGKIAPTNPLDEAIISDTISHVGNMAIRTGRKITWDPNTGEAINDPEANRLFHRNIRDSYKV